MKRLSHFTLSLLFLGPALAEPTQPLEQVLSKFEKLASELFRQSGVPGMSIAIVKDGETVYLKGFGVRQASTNQPVDPDTLFQLASCSKPMTSTAIAVLAGQGKLTFDDHIAKVFPEFSVSDRWVSEHLTYRDLLSHHSGLPEFAGDILEDLGYDRETILTRLRHLPPAYDFRVGYAYTNFGFTAAGEAAARASGESYEEMMADTLFRPAGMNSTSARFEDFANSPRRAVSHQLVSGKAVPTVRMPQAQAPAGGVSSTAKDVARYMQLHLQHGKLDGQTLVPEETLAQTYRVHSLASNNPATFSAGGFYGLGWGVSYDNKGRLKVSHSGAFELGVRTSITMLPQERVGIAVLANAYPSALPEALTMSFLKMADGEEVSLSETQEFHNMVLTHLEEMLTPNYRMATPSKATPPLKLSSYTGTFDNDFFGPVIVSQEKSGLVIRIGARTFHLQHLDRDVFAAVPPSTTFEDLGPFELQFATDGDGKVTGFRQKGLGGGPPWFQRSR